MQDPANSAPTEDDPLIAALEAQLERQTVQAPARAFPEDGGGFRGPPIPVLAEHDTDAPIAHVRGLGYDDRLLLLAQAFGNDSRIHWVADRRFEVHHRGLYRGVVEVMLNGELRWVA